MESGGRPHSTRRYRETRRVLARSETPGTYGNTTHGSREILRPPAESNAAGRIEKSKDARR
jgi:hypothetical protein